MIVESGHADIPAAAPRPQHSPAVALAALVAVLHLSVLARRLSGRTGPLRGDVLTWRAPADGPTSQRNTNEKTPSNPIRTYSAGELALNTGVAIVALAAWLRVMRMNGTHGN